LLALVTIVASIGVTVAAVVLVTKHRGESPQDRYAVVKEVRPDANAQLEIPGVAALEVPKGAVASATEASLSLGGEDPLGSISNESRARLSETPPIQVDLSGKQPLVPLKVTITVPAGIDMKWPVLVTKHAGELKYVEGQYDAGSRRFSAQLAELSPVTLVDVYQAAVKFMTGVLDVTGLRGKKPDCAGKAAKLADGSTVKVTNLTGTDTLWPCVSVGGDQVRVEVNSVAGTFWRVTSSGGTYEGAAEVSLQDAATQALFQGMVRNPKLGEGLILPQGSGSWQVAPGALPINMTAKLSGGLWFAQVTAFTVVWLAEVGSGGQAGVAFDLAQKLSKALESGKPLECISKAADTAKEGLALTPDLIVGLSKTLLACAGDIVKAVTGSELKGLAALIFTIFESGIATIWGALEVSLRNALSIWRPSLTQFGWRVAREQAVAACPSADAIKQAMISQSEFWQATDAVVSRTIVCAGPYASAGIHSEVQGYHVLLEQRASGLTLLRVGTGPLCSIFLEDSVTSMTVVPPQYGKALDCITTH
jgi:hypothetical protein